MESRQMPNQPQGFSQLPQKEKAYTLQNLVNKLNRGEQMSYGNYFVNFADMFPKEAMYKE